MRILPLVRQVLSNLGLTITEVSGVLVIHPGSTPGGDPADQELWVYTPKHRTIAAMAGYFSLFPRLTFNYSGSPLPHTSEFAAVDPFGPASRLAADGQLPMMGNPSLDIGGAVLTGQATGYGATLSALVPQNMPGASIRRSFKTQPRPPWHPTSSWCAVTLLMFSI